MGRFKNLFDARFDILISRRQKAETLGEMGQLATRQFGNRLPFQTLRSALKHFLYLFYSIRPTKASKHDGHLKQKESEINQKANHKTKYQQRCFRSGFWQQANFNCVVDNNLV